jgi:hypothetical protein
MKDIWIQFVFLDCEMRFVHKNDAPFLLQLHGTYSYTSDGIDRSGTPWEHSIHGLHFVIR